MSDIVIKTEGLGKSYFIGHQPNERYVSLRDVIVNKARSLWSKISSPCSLAHQDVEEFWALKDVSFEVKQGDRIGIIGRNGAGKSTLLKILSRITEPTVGRVTIRGRIASLLEVGTGFHPELTGRENIFLNGAILGMTRQEIKRKFDEIVAFAEVKKFLDTPVKHFSSGMYVRLAFAVAAHLEPEILVVDEVLAVGDASFQKKCLGKMRDVATEGRTVLFVSHNMGAIQSLCKRVIWLDGGLQKGDGESGNIIQQYISSASERDLFSPKSGSGYTDIIIERAVLRNKMGQETNVFQSGDPIRIEIYYKALKRINRPNFWVGVISQFGGLFGANMLFDEACPDCLDGQGSIACTFIDVRLLPMTYTITLGIRGSDAISNHIPATDIASFSIVDTSEKLGLSASAANFYNSFWPLLVSYEWRLPDGKIVKVNNDKERI